ncbi:MAG: hypothetical protein ABR585_10535 [Gemmatimonadaceae bacterium]
MTGFAYLTITLSLTGAIIDCATVTAQQSSSALQARTQAIVASFNKSKHVVKERHGVRREKYKDVRSEPVVKSNPQEYSGTYEVTDMGFRIVLRVEPNGDVAGSGYEPAGPDPSIKRQFTLTNAKIQGALLTATQNFANGERDRFEGVFINRASFESPTDKGTTEFGLGVMGKDTGVAGLTINKFFYQRTN